MLDNTSSRISVVLVDSQSLVRKGLVLLLNSIPGINVIADFENTDHVLEFIAKNHVDLIITEIDIPGMNVLDFLESLRQETISPKIIILSSSAPQNYCKKTFRSGATGYVLKTDEVDELKRCITEVIAGKTFISLEAKTRLSDQVVFNDMAQPVLALTRTELKVLSLIAVGHRNKEIANLLHISRRTVEVHHAHISKKLQIKGVARLVQYAIKHGIVSEGIDQTGLSEPIPTL